jgi:hypothetical protein
MDMEKYQLPRSQDSSVTIVTGWMVGVRFLIWARDFFPHHSGWDMKQTTHLNLVPRSRMVELYLHSFIHHHGVVFNCLIN